MNAHNEQQWPEYLMLRDTGLSDDAGGLGQRIYTTAGAGYEKQKYVRADLASQPSPVVKQNLTTQPAAAQEAVACRYRHRRKNGRFFPWSYADTLPANRIEGTEYEPLYAAPVTAAPVGDLFVECRQCEECNHAGINDSGDNLAACLAGYWSGMAPDEDRCPECDQTGCMSAACPKCGARYKLVASAEFPASTPAAPGIDLARFRAPVLSWIERNKEIEFLSDTAAWAVAEGAELLALIDASPKGDDGLPVLERLGWIQDSPKGGSEARDAARYRWLREFAVNGSIGIPFHGWLNCDEPASEWDSAIDDAMQAGDAEVQP